MEIHTTPKNERKKAPDKKFLLEKNDREKAVHQYTVFLVEDDSDDRRQAVHTLRKSPYIYNIHCFESGDRLIEHFATVGYYSNNMMRHIPTLIMLDIHTPGTDGLDILGQLKQDPMMQNIPVAILTGDTSGKAALDAYKLRADAFIAKPLNLDHVHEVIYASWENTDPENKN